MSDKNPESGNPKWSGLRKLAAGCIEENKYAQLTGKYLTELLDELDLLETQLATTFKLSGADCDGNEDWRIAPEAVREVTRLRDEADASSKDSMALREVLKAVLQDEGTRLRPSVLERVAEEIPEVAWGMNIHNDKNAKIIQLCSHVPGDGIQPALYAVCDDGTVYTRQWSATAGEVWELDNGKMMEKRP